MTNPLTQSMVFFDRTRHDQDVHDLRKEMRQKECDFEKQKAILQQKVELLELQLRESQEREENAKKMHETMMSALRSGEDEGKSSKESELAQQLLKREMQDAKEAHEAKMKEMRGLLNEKDTKVKHLQIQMEELEIDAAR